MEAKEIFKLLLRSFNFPQYIIETQLWNNDQKSDKDILYKEDKLYSYKSQIYEN